ncbi:hypothetical protein K7X08_030295 [Anisodus acutangulus]|uniref:Uncharacterized protein n=1 Tax=Anisodus acutangulus TaxID=402998 RepID=A0A9Q1LR14_9SOLA|nr:hypothetical protein K7X08_030295 [Anisodus acutangulus]
MLFSVGHLQDFNILHYEIPIDDAWLDIVDTDKRFSGKNAIKILNEDEIQDLTSEQLGKMKRRIVDVLEPGETP